MFSTTATSYMLIVRVYVHNPLTMQIPRVRGRKCASERAGENERARARARERERERERESAAREILCNEKRT